MKKRFNTNIEENKLIKLKQIALNEGVGANDLIEKWVDEYLEDGTKKAKSLWKRMGFSTQVPECVLEELEEKGINLKEYKILQSIEWRHAYTKEHIKEYGITNEINAEVSLIEVESEEIYTLHYNWIMTDREMIGEDRIEAYLNKSKYSKEDIIRSMEYVWKEKDEYQDFEREIRIDDVSVRFMPVRGYNKYTIDTILLRNTRAIKEIEKC